MGYYKPKNTNNRPTYGPASARTGKNPKEWHEISFWFDVILTALWIFTNIYYRFEQSKPGVLNYGVVFVVLGLFSLSAISLLIYIIALIIMLSTNRKSKNYFRGRDFLKMTIAQIVALIPILFIL